MRAEEYLKQAIALDPQWAEPHSVLGSEYFRLGFFGLRPPGEAVPLARTEARRALELLSNSTLNNASAGKKENALDSLLSEREMEILQCTIKGLTPKQIADTLFISIFTVRKHIAHIYEKLHVSNTTQVMSLAYKNGWVK